MWLTLRDVIIIDARLGKDLRQASRRVLIMATPDTRIAAVKLIKTQGENVFYQLIISSTESSRAQQCESQVRRHFCHAHCRLLICRWRPKSVEGRRDEQPLPQLHWRR